MTGATYLIEVTMNSGRPSMNRWIVSVVLLLSLAPAGYALDEENQPLAPDELVSIPPEKVQAQIREELGKGFHVCESDHFQVIGDSSPRYQRVLAGVLELFYREVHSRFFKRKMKPIKVHVIHDRKDYEPFVTKRGRRDMLGSACNYSSEERAIYGMRFRGEGVETSTGAFFHATLYPMLEAEFRRRPPEWFRLGMAMLFERARIIKGRLVYGNPCPWREDELIPAFRKDEVPDLETLLTMSDEEFNGTYHTYCSIRSFFLYLARSGEGKLARFVELMRAGRTGPRALKSATGKKLEEVEREWNESIKTVNFAGYCVYRAEEGEEGVEKLTEALEKLPGDGYLHYCLALYLNDVQRFKEACEHAALALEDPRFIRPQDAYDIMGYYHGYKSLKLAEAEEAFRNAASYQPWLLAIQQYSYINLAKIQHFQGDVAGAEETAEKLTALREGDRRVDTEP
jgi:hypothetical protein